MVSCLSTLGVWARTLPARARDPWTFPVEKYIKLNKYITKKYLREDGHWWPKKLRCWCPRIREKRIRHRESCFRKTESRRRLQGVPSNNIDNIQLKLIQIIPSSWRWWSQGQPQSGELLHRGRWQRSACWMPRIELPATDKSIYRSENRKRRYKN